MIKFNLAVSWLRTYWQKDNISLSPKLHNLFTALMNSDPRYQYIGERDTPDRLPRPLFGLLLTRSSLYNGRRSQKNRENDSSVAQTCKQVHRHKNRIKQSTVNKNCYCTYAKSRKNSRLFVTITFSCFGNGGGIT